MIDGVLTLFDPPKGRGLRDAIEAYTIPLPSSMTTAQPPWGFERCSVLAHVILTIADRQPYVLDDEPTLRSLLEGHAPGILDWTGVADGHGRFRWNCAISTVREIHHREATRSTPGEIIGQRHGD